MQRCHNNRQVPSKKYLLALIIPALMSQQAFAEEANEPSVDLGTEYITIKKPTPKIATKIISDKQISRQMVTDSKDLVRYETGISVVEAGRFGSSGYAIRGVDENRVAITVDGLHQAETLSSQGFKELFEGYGNFNNTRNSVEMEHLKRATIRKGADSVKVGSGALGGSVTFETKEADDYLTDKNYHIGYKTGYATADNQRFSSVSMAGRYKWFDALVIHTDRDGHETENYGYKSYNEFIQGREREKADPYDKEMKSTLFKLAVSPNDNHRLTLVADTYKTSVRGHDFSYTLKPNTQYMTYDEQELRHTNDQVKRTNYAFNYQNWTANPLYDSLKLSFSRQNIKTRARTDDYCDGNEKCPAAKNPLGMRYNSDNKLVGQDNQEVVYVPQSFTGVRRDPSLTINGQTYDADETRELISSDQILRTNTVNLLNCTGINCDKGSITGFDIATGNPIELPFDVIERNGERLARINAQRGSQLTAPVLLVPGKPGYVDDLYTERDLKTKTTQVDLDLTKGFDTKNLKHLLNYGLSWSKSDKSMINRSGFEARNIQWWATYPENCSQAVGNADRYNSLCQNSNVFSFLIPVETKTSAVYLADNIRITDKLELDVGYRYDRIKHNPYYEAGVTPKIPDDMVTNLYVTEPTFDQTDYVSAANEANRTANANANIAYIAQPKKYSASSYALGLNFTPLSWLNTQVKYSKGFRAPTGEEVYFTFKHPDFSIMPNKDLNAEIAKNKEIAFTIQDDMGYITTSIFRTDYTDFIDLAYKGNRQLQGHSMLTPFQVYQNINRQNAKVNGFEIDTRLNIDEIFPSLEGLNASYRYTHQKGRMEGDLPMNAIQPHTMVFGLGYDHPSNKFGANLYLTHASAKKAEDTYNMYYQEEGKQDSFVKWRSGAYNIVDFTAYIRPIKNLTVQAGVYNLFDKKYLTWDSARSIRSFGTSNLINQETGAGIARFYAPERNFKVAVEYKF